MRNALIGFASAVLALGTVVLTAQIPRPASVSARPVHIHVDLNRKQGIYKPIYSWFGYDEANYTTMRHGVELLRELHDLSPVPVYIRCHNLLTSGNGVPDLKQSSTNVYSENSSGNPVYDFTTFDGIFDAYKAAGVRPIIELGYMPRDLAAIVPGPATANQRRKTTGIHPSALNIPPKDYGKWGDMIRTITAHLVDRYGRDTVLHWYFEVWNEPDVGYWRAHPEAYWKLYDYAAAGVRSVLPAAMVGGPATTGPGDLKAHQFLEEFLQHVNSGKSAATGGPIPFDFVSFHAKGQTQFIQGHVQMNLRHELVDVDKGFELVAKYPRLRQLPIILSEADPEGCAACSSKMNPANNYRNGTLYPAYTAAAFKAIFELQDRRGVDLISMLTWAFEFENREYFEGFRSLATNGIDKPILNFFRMAALMSGDRVYIRSDGATPLDQILANGVVAAPDVDAMATSRVGQAAVLMWNYQDQDESGAATPITITVSGLPRAVHRVLVSHFRIDNTHSNAYTVWLAMGFPQNPSAEQYAELKANDGLQLLTSPEWADVKAGQITLTTELPHESVSLIHVEWR